MEQSYGQVTGHLRDMAATRNCSQALVSILRPDSSLVRSTLSAKDGRFQFPGIWLAGNYILLVMHPDYRTSFRPFAISSLGVYDFGTILVLPKIDSLQAVVITPGDLRPHFRRDTVEYNTTHIRMNTNANVEEMIGRLPGLQVDLDGNITYNGQKIQRVLVDGQELFGSDLTIATRNLNADMIAKIQVLDSKSKEAQFTGIDDGQRTKTLNLILKEDSKKGYFIKTGVSAEGKRYYDVNGILGSFNRKQQVMVLGLASDIGSMGFNGVSGGLGTGLYLGSGVNDALDASAGTGIPKAIGGAAHYSNDWGVYGDHADGYYRYGHMFTRPFSNSLTEQVLPDSIYAQNQERSSVNKIDEQVFESHFSYNIDSFSAFQFTLRGGNSQGRNQLNSTSSGSFNDTLVNNNLRDIRSDVTSQNWYGDMMWRIQGRRRRERVFSILANISDQMDNTGGYLYSVNNFFQSHASLLSSDTVDERKSILIDGFNLNTYMSFVEPVWKNTVLGLRYGITLNKSQTEQSTFDRGDGKYQELIDSLSSRYRDIFTTQRGTLNLQGQSKTFTYVLGADLLQYNYRENNLWNETVLKYHYLNFAPRVKATFNPNPSSGYSFEYSSTTQLPSVLQLQPTKNNNDPLHITLGNPNIRPSYSHFLGFNFHRGKSIRYTVGFTLGLVNNSISTKIYTDSLGRQVSQATNADGSGNGSLYFYLNTKLKPLGMDVGFTDKFSFGRMVNYVNNLLSKNDSYGVDFGFSLAKYVANVYNFRIVTNFLYTTTSSTINTGLKTSYWSQLHTAQLGFFPWKNWEINTNANYTWRQKTSIFDNHNSVLLWNAFLSRNFVDNRLTARLAINDILGQNAGITRSIAANQVSQTTSNMIGRYWMLSVLYRFTKKGGK
jgi:hypothetical protein